MAGVGVGTGAFGSVLGKLATLLGNEFKMLKRVRKDIESLQQELRRMQILVSTLADMEGLDEVAKDWKDSMRDLSYDMEECIDRYMLRLGNGEVKPKFVKKTMRRIKTIFERHGIGSQIKELKDRVEEESKRRQTLNLDKYAANRPVAIDPRLAAFHRAAKDLVGMDGRRDEVISLLTEQSVKLKVVYIVGGGGLGKNTLAMEAFGMIGGQFGCKAHVSVSRTPDLKKLLKDVLSQIDQDGFSRCEGWEDHQLIRQIHRALAGKRYFLVIDDRISLQSNPHAQRLQEILDGILRKCGGLPLAIITISSLLANRPQNTDEWERLQASIGTGLSYQTDGTGKEDWHISCEELKWKWIAEGFIAREQGNLYLEAESCLHELVNRSLIQLVNSNVDDDGLKKYCQVHDMVLDLIISLSDGENFATILNSVRNSLPSGKTRRLSLQSSGLDLKKAIHDMTRSKLHVRSLHVFVEAKEILPLVDFQSLRVFDTCVGHWSWKKEHISNIGSFYQLRYLRIQGRNIEELPKDIGKLQNLETLDLRGTYIRKLPPTIALLTKLMCLFIEHNYDVEFSADMFGCMPALEEVSDIGRVDNPEKFLAELAHRQKLRKISMNYLWIGNGDQDNVRGYRERLASSLNELCNKHNLRYLHSHGHMAEYLFSDPHTFERLQHLKLDVYYMERLPRGMASLTNILKLEMRVTLFDEEGRNILMGMPYLTYLQLDVMRSAPDVMNVSSEGFNLLEVFDYEVRFGAIQFAAGAMPALRRLHLSCSANCLRNADIDMGIEHLSSLAHLELKTDCIGESRHSVEALEDSVRKAVALHPNLHTLQLHVSRSFESHLS
ncbi:hypothetical protein ACQJBY_067462 [Aegilops geniculata]